MSKRERGDTFWVEGHAFRGKHFVVVNVHKDEQIDLAVAKMDVVDQNCNEYTFVNIGNSWGISQPCAEITTNIPKDAIHWNE